jgi:hypothetical protein
MEPEDVVARASPNDRATDTQEGLSDEKLAELALAADPDAGVAADAIPLDELLESETPSPGRDLLPHWYMPAPMGGSGLLQGWRRKTAFLIIAAFIVITAYGLCTAYVF